MGNVRHSSCARPLAASACPHQNICTARPSHGLSFAAARHTRLVTDVYKRQGKDVFGLMVHKAAQQCAEHAAGEGHQACLLYTSVQGILYGYQTMDTRAGLNFGAVIALNIRARGVTESLSLIHISGPRPR